MFRGRHLEFLSIFAPTDILRCRYQPIPLNCGNSSFKLHCKKQAFWFDITTACLFCSQSDLDQFALNCDAFILFSQMQILTAPIVFILIYIGKELENNRLYITWQFWTLQWVCNKKKLICSCKFKFFAAYLFRSVRIKLTIFWETEKKRGNRFKYKTFFVAWGYHYSKLINKPKIAFEVFVMSQLIAINCKPRWGQMTLKCVT